MAIVRRVVGRELDPETRAAMEAEVREAAKRPYVYDPDCPLLTEEQLAEFRPVNYATNEERLAAMGLRPASHGESARNSWASLPDSLRPQGAGRTDPPDRYIA